MSQKQILTKSGCSVLWTSQNGRVTEIQDLHSAHLANILRKLEQTAREDFFLKMPLPNGQPAHKWFDCLPEIYDHLADEAIIRGVNWHDCD